MNQKVNTTKRTIFQQVKKRKSTVAKTQRTQYHRSNGNIYIYL